MINPAILSTQVRAKLEKTCLTAIVTEAFINALPFDTAEVREDSKKYVAYANTVLESLHSETILKDAMKAHANNPKAMNLLSSIQEAIESVVAPATQRIVTEATTEKKTNMSEVLDKTAFTDKEKAKLVQKASDLKIETISEIIKKKVVDTIKDEKMAHDAALKLKNDIKTNLEDTLGESAPSLESYMDTVLKKGDARDHVSFFSRLQDTCMESLMIMNDSMNHYDPEYVSYESLIMTTLTSTLDCFDQSILNLDDSLTALSNCVESVTECDMADKHDYAKKSLIMSIIIITILETLKTMNLFSPKLASVQKFVDSPTNMNTPAQNVCNKIHEEIVSVKRDLPKMDRDRMTAALGCFNQMKSSVSAISEELLPNKEKVMEELTDISTIIEQNLAKSQEVVEESVFDYWTIRAREANVAECDRIARIMFRNPNTKKIRIDIEDGSACEATNTVIVKGFDGRGMNTDQISASIAIKPGLENILSEIKTASTYSNLFKYVDQCEIYHTAKCKAEPLFS